MVAAVGSWLDAKAHGGRWKLRIDDLDAPRVAPGSVDSILRVLEGYGLIWDDVPVFQSKNFARYEEALSSLKASGNTYACRCTRKDWKNSLIYPGICRELDVSPARSIRFKSKEYNICWDDRECGDVEIQTSREVGDFLLRNAHGIYSYQLANAVDDEDMGITDVVRGADLLTVTAAHIALQQCLHNRAIRYRHLPLALSPDGHKLSKATSAVAVTVKQAPEVLAQVFEHLGLGEYRTDSPVIMLEKACLAWEVGLRP